MALKTTRGDAGGAVKGRGAPSNLEGRFESVARERADDGWEREEQALPPLRTIVTEERARSIISRNDSPDVGFDQSINPYRGCEHGCVYCLAGDTAILLASGAVKPLAELRVGDEIYGTEKRGHYRYYVKTRVLAHWQARKPAYRIELADGTTVVASGDHRFLTERGWKFVDRRDVGGRWSRLTVNNTLMGFGSLDDRPPGAHTGEYRRGYLCGMIRGDGHLGRYSYVRRNGLRNVVHRFRLAMADADALDRSDRFLREFGVATDRFLFQAATPKRRRMEAIRISSRAAVDAIARLIEWPDRYEGDWARGFVAGIFDAEGSYANGTIRIANTDERMIGAT
ncbi:MAG TPA: hypothetical protein VML91_08295, partial [Burkholderiales bacterium]|nr:hypothetical protein [Burkholderiales bacterium]